MNTKSLFILAGILIFTILTTSLQGCKNSAAKTIEPSELEGLWILKNMNEQEAKNLFENALPTLQFDFQEMTIFGTGGCNRYNGGFELEKNVLSAPNLAVTRMLCIGKNEEAQFFIEMRKSNTLSISNNILTFTDNDGKVVLEFEKTQN